MSDGRQSRQVTGGRSRSRRGLLRSLAVAGVAGLAGCGGAGTGTEPIDSTGSPSTSRASSTDSPTPSPSPTAGVVTSSATPSETPTTAAATPSATVTPGELSVPTDDGGSIRDRVARIGAAIRPAVVDLGPRSLGRDATGLFLEASLVVTAASTLGADDSLVEQPSVGTIDGRSHDAELLARTTQSEDRASDLAVVRVEAEGPTLPAGSPDDLSTGDVVVQVAHNPYVGRWAIQFGRVRRWTEDGRFVTSLPFPTPGGPVVTLGGDLVAVTTRAAGTDPPGTETPPPTEPPTVYTDRNQWRGIRQVPVGDVRAFVEEATR